MKLTKIFLFFILAAFVIACTSETKTVAPSQQQVKVQAFSDTLKQDTFKVALRGTESANMSMVFTITNFNGKEIYKEEIKAESVLKSYLASEELKKENDKIKFLNDEVSFFFDDEHFLVPAVTTEEKPDENAPDKAFYEELKQTKLNGFAYSLGKDKQVYIAWSEKEKKVKVYYKCC